MNKQGNYILLIYYVKDCIRLYSALWFYHEKFAVHEFMKVTRLKKKRRLCLHYVCAPNIKGFQLVLTLLKPFKMKKLLGVLMVFSFACSKDGGKTCWDCEVTRLDRSTYYQKVCNDGTYPRFNDRQGNKLSSFCSKR